MPPFAVASGVGWLPALHHRSKSVFIGGPIVQCGWIKVSSVRPNQGVVRHAVPIVTAQPMLPTIVFACLVVSVQ
jgi:hypothetical protein